MKIQVWNYSKEENNTARPASAPLREYDIVLKERTSFNSPTFVLNLGGELPDFNYVYWVDIEQYYYVSDVISRTNDVFEIVCAVDPLATTRPYIFNSKAFVKYSTKSFNEYLRDDRIVPTVDIETLVSNNSFESLFNTHPEYTSSYSLLLTVLNGDETSNEAGICHYLINATTLRYLCSEITLHGEDIIAGVKQTFADAKDCLLKLQLVPWSVSGLQASQIIGSNTSPIFLGSYQTTQSGYRIDANAVYSTDDFVELPSRPANFASIEPYCSATVHIPLIGTYQLSLADVQDASKIYFRYFANIGSGKATCILWKGHANINNSNVKILGVFDGNINADVPLGYQTSQNPVGILTGVGSLVAGLASGGALTIAGIAGAVASMASQFMRQSSVTNAFGGNASSKDNLKLSVAMIKHGLSEEPENMGQLFGRPCGKVLDLSTLTDGYVQTVEFHFKAPFDKYILDEVESYMDAGVYLY